MATAPMSKKKKKRTYECTACGAPYTSWAGQCIKCEAWDSLTLVPEDHARQASAMAAGDVARLSPVVISTSHPDEEEDRVETGLAEFDRAIGGGFVSGSYVLIGGEPGIGKSTLVMQIAQALGRNGTSVLYVSGEESIKQVTLRSRRLGDFPPNVRIATTSSLEAIELHVTEHPVDVLVIDSIQTMATSRSGSAAGSVAQVREVTAALMQLAKQKDTIVILVGHVLKDGSIAGPRVLEHMVDVVLYFDSSPREGYKLLRNYKNRFGSTAEIGLFEMTPHGLQSIDQPASFFYATPRPGRTVGACATCSFEGSRAFLCEVQALVVRRENTFGPIVRRSVGLDTDRSVLMSAVVEKYLKKYISGGDIYINVAGGGEVKDQAADLSVCAALLSSSLDLPIREHTALLGEVGLTGEVRAVQHLRLRVDAAAKMGISNFLVPPETKATLAKEFKTHTFTEIGHVSELVSEVLFPDAAQLLPGKSKAATKASASAGSK